MKTTHLLLIAICFCQVSCDDNSDASLPESPHGSLSGSTDFFRRNAVQAQIFNVGTGGDTIVGAEGTIIEIDYNAFVDANGQPVTDPVTVSFREIYTKKDMLFSNFRTTSNGWPLYSAGMFRVEATANGMPVRFVVPYTARVHCDVLDYNMDLFYGTEEANGAINWLLTDSVFNPGGNIWFDSTAQGNSYMFQDTTTLWNNVDVFYFAPQDISITLNTLNNPNPDSTYAFVWFTGFNAFWDLQPNGSGNFSSSHVKPVPVSLIAFTVSNGNMYAGILTIPSLTANGNYSLPLQEMSEQAFKDAVAALN